MSGEEVHNRIMKNMLKVILCDPDKLSLSTIMELKKDLAELNDDKLMPKIKGVDRFNNDEELMVNEFENKF